MHPFHEEDPRELVKLLGADHVIFGSDYPHVEGLADPLSWADELHGLSDEDLRKVMGGNMVDLFKVEKTFAGADVAGTVEESECKMTWPT